MKQIFVYVQIFLIIILGGCGSAEVPSSKIEILNPYVMAVLVGKPTGGTSSGAAYFTIKNSGTSSDKLLRVEGDAANLIALHQTVTKENSTRMQAVDSIEIPANGEVELKPGSYHIMLVGIKDNVKLGDWITLTLVFERAGNINVTAEIKNP
jgi:periplasmic copper chaperone A